MHFRADAAERRVGASRSSDHRYGRGYETLRQVRAMTAAALPITTVRPRMRFTLSGMMFVFVVGVSIGCAYWRLPMVTFGGALLASFTTWFVIGIVQRVWRDTAR